MMDNIAAQEKQEDEDTNEVKYEIDNEAENGVENEDVEDAEKEASSMLIACEFAMKNLPLLNRMIPLHFGSRVHVY